MTGERVVKSRVIGRGARWPLTSTCLHVIARYLHVALDLSKGVSEVTATGAKPNAESAAAYLLLRTPDSTPDSMPDEDDQLLLIAAQKSVRHQRTNEVAQLT